MNASAVRDDGEWLTVNDAADRLGVSRQTVLNRALAGRLKVKMIGSRYFVSRRSVEQALPAGVPPHIQASAMQRADAKRKRRAAKRLEQRQDT